jgi:hypothetical protein
MNAFGPQQGTAAAWQSELVLALRLRDVPGPRIGEVLAEVEAHCADSGQSPAEAFGDPEAYAAEVTPGWQPPPARSWLLQAVATPLGVTALLSGAAASGRSAGVTVTVGGLLSVAVTVALIVTVVARLDVVLRAPWRAWLGISAALLALAGLPVLLPQLLGTVPAGSLLVTGTLLLAVVWWRSRGASAQGDEVVDPRTGAPAHPAPAWAALVVRWGLPVGLLLAVVLVVLLPD